MMAFLNVKAMLALQLRYFPTRHSVSGLPCQSFYQVVQAGASRANAA